jgi:hypothetical protein
MPDLVVREMENQLATLEAELKGVYRERAHLVAFLTSVLPATLAETDPDTPGWPVVTVDTPAGQLSWHIAPEDTDLFGHMDRTPEGIAWDGHSTEEKYERLHALTEAIAASGSVPPLAWLGTKEPEPEHDQAEPEPKPEPEPKKTTTPRAKKAGA